MFSQNFAELIASNIAGDAQTNSRRTAIPWEGLEQARGLCFLKWHHATNGNDTWPPSFPIHEKNIRCFWSSKNYTASQIFKHTTRPTTYRACSTGRLPALAHRPKKRWSATKFSQRSSLLDCLLDLSPSRAWPANMQTESSRQHPLTCAKYTRQ